MKYDLCLSHPTTVILIGNEVSFLSDINPLLSIESSIYKVISNPDYALEIINDRSTFNKPTEHNLERPFSNTLEQRRIIVNINTIHLELLNPDRFNRISTVIIDSDMQNINGLKLCTMIQNPYIKKIILIEKAEEQSAIDAFNHGLIDGFIKKDEKIKTANKLDQLIKKVQNEYFSDLSLVIQDAIKNYPEEETAFGKNYFRKFFCKILKQYSIVEFYLIESIGSYLMLNAVGEAFILFLKNEDQMEAAYHEIKTVKTIPQKIKQQLKDKKSILCCTLMQNKSLPEYSEWPKYLENAYPIEQSEFFYAISKNTCQLISSKFFSFKNYHDFINNA